MENSEFTTQTILADHGQMRTNRILAVSVVIVNYNGGLLVSEAVRSVLSSTVPVRVYVVDNGSTDDSLPSLRDLAGADGRILIIENHSNLGFARAVNIALERAQDNFILVLNPDVVIKPDTLARMLQTLADHPEAGMAGCLLRNPDGTEQAGCRRSVPTPWRALVRTLHLGRLFPNHPWFSGFELIRQPLPATPVFLEAISGAFMLVRRQALMEVGYLDEKYFLHCEDLDWCMRFRQAGWKILFVPGVEVVHYQGTCSQRTPLFVLWHKHKGMIRFYRKFFQHQYPWWLMFLVMAGVWTRFTLLAIARVFLLPRKPAWRQPPMRQTAEDDGKRPSPQVAVSDAEPPAVDPMLIISQASARHGASRFPD
jgi:GT2 family glycosyltransferase